VTAGPVPDVAAALDFLGRYHAAYTDTRAWVGVTSIDADRLDHAWATIDDLASLGGFIDAARQAGGVYFTACPRREKPGRHQRGGAEDCHSLTALWCDLDVAGPVHKAAGLPVDGRQVRRLVDRFPLRPSLVAPTGGGFQSWWLLDEPVLMPDAAELLARWKATWTRLAAAEGCHVDNVWDLARICRLPGTVNRKPALLAPHFVTVKGSWGRYGVTDLAEHLDEVPHRRPRGRHGADDVYDELNRSTPWGDFDARVGAAGVLHLTEKKARGVWSLVRTASNGDQHWRYSEAEHPTSATVYASDGSLCIWSETFASEFPHVSTMVGYLPNELYTMVFCDGDFAASAGALRDQGYGDDHARVPPPASSPQQTTWPHLDDAALLGVPGEVVHLYEPYTEADPVGLLLGFLTGFGNAVGLGPYMRADGAEHRANLFGILVGRTAKSRKGTAWARINPVLGYIDSAWASQRILSGLSSGEGVITALSDEQTDKKGDIVAPARDKRLLIIEEEFSKVLAVCRREGSTLTEVLRQAWDGRDLATLTRNPLSARNPHFSLVGHITLEELRAKLLETDQLNGFANRFVYALVKRAQIIPDGGSPAENDEHRLATRVEGLLRQAKQVGEVRRTPAAAELWTDLYYQMAEDDEVGLVGAAASRVEPHTLRFSLVYALACGSSVVDVDHLKAGWALWRYCRQSLEFIFGDRLGDDVADRLLTALQAVHPEGLDRTAQHQLFGRHVSAGRLNAATELLVRLRMVEVKVEKTDGRDRQVLVYRRPQ
jgi:hypothetical protein